MLMKAMRTMRYNRKPVARGETFEATPKDARTLQAVKLAGVFEDDQAKQKPAKKIAQATIEEAASDELDSDGVEISPRTGLPKRQYRRRDMTAEGGDSE